jgi:hypothetical protein
MFESIDGRLKPLAIMIKRAYQKSIILWISLSVLSLGMGYICDNSWWGLVLIIPISVIIRFLCKIEKDIKDYLISI